MTLETTQFAKETTTLDPVTLEVLWNRLLSVANEQQAALMRTAFSTVVRESQDLACGVFDTRGQMMAQSLTGTPGHINPMATGVRELLAAYPPETLGPWLEALRPTPESSVSGWSRRRAHSEIA